MKIEDISSNEGREECLDCSLGLLALPAVKFCLNEDSYKIINEGPPIIVKKNLPIEV